jgi:hypothetical protein
MELEIIMLSKVSRIQKEKCYMFFSHMQNLGKKDIKVEEELLGNRKKIRGRG